MSTSVENKSADDKSTVNPLFNPRYKPRSVQSAKDVHIPRLTHKNADFKYIFIGDSNWERYMSTGAGKEFDKETDKFVDVGQKANLWHKYHQMKAINLGVEGDGISEVLHRLFKLNVAEYLPTEPTKIVLWVGTNDIERYTEDIVYDGMLNLVKKIQDSYHSIKKNVSLAVVSILPRFSRNKKISVSDLNRSIQRLNYMLATAAPKNGFEFLDVYFKFYDNRRILNDYFEDHVHLNYDGYTIFDAELHKFLVPPTTDNELEHTRTTPPTTPDVSAPYSGDAIVVDVEKDDLDADAVQDEHTQ